MLRRTLSTLALGLALAAGGQAAPLWGTQTSASIGDMFPSTGQNNFSFDADGPVDPVSDEPVGGALATESAVDDAKLSAALRKASLKHFDSTGT